MFTDIITIDGPPASGKTTMAHLLAQKFGLTHLDSGAIFRALTLYCMEKGVDLNNPQDVINKFSSAQIYLSGEAIFLNGIDISQQIRNPMVTDNVCFISNLKEIRNFVSNMQQSYAKRGKIVSDGRKVGSEVFPNAKVKFYLTARQGTRALRRYHQLLCTGNTVLFADVYNSLKQREEQERRNGILVIPENAIVIDNSELTIEETLFRMEEYLF